MINPFTGREAVENFYQAYAADSGICIPGTVKHFISNDEALNLALYLLWACQVRGISRRTIAYEWHSITGDFMLLAGRTEIGLSPIPPITKHMES